MASDEQSLRYVYFNVESDGSLRDFLLRPRGAEDVEDADDGALGVGVVRRRGGEKDGQGVDGVFLKQRHTLSLDVMHWEVQVESEGLPYRPRATGGAVRAGMRVGRDHAGM